MVARLTSLVIAGAAIAVATAGVAGCESFGAARTGSAAAGSSQFANARPDSTEAVPSVIHRAYVSDVVASLEHVRGDALRDGAGRSGALPIADRARLADIYADGALADQLQAFTAAAAGPPDPAIRNPPGDEQITVLNILAADSHSIVVRATVDNSAVTKSPVPDGRPWILALAAAPKDDGTTPWKFNFGAIEAPNWTAANLEASSQWDETAFGLATAPDLEGPLVANDTPATPVPADAPLSSSPLSPLSTPTRSTPATPSATASPPGSKNKSTSPSPAPVSADASPAPARPVAVVTTTSTTEDPVVSAAKVRAYAQQMLAASELPKPTPTVLLDGGTFTRQAHRLDIGLTPQVSTTRSTTPFGPAVLTVTGRVLVDWGDGSTNVYNYADYNWNTTPISHVWYGANTYAINVMVTWSAAYTIGPYLGTVRTGVLDPTSTAGHTSLPLTEYPITH